jgi:putative oxidoreductase
VTGSFDFTRWKRLEEAGSSSPRETPPPQQEPRPPQRESAPHKLLEPEEHSEEEVEAAGEDDSATTAIERDEPADDVSEDIGQPLVAERDPLPSVQPRLVDDPRLKIAKQRGTQHLGLMVLRAGVGAVLGAHGLQNAFGWWGGQGHGGFRNSLSDLGFQHADILAWVAAGGQIGAGALLILGWFTPVVAAGVLAYLINGLLANIATQHRHGHPAFLLDGNEYHVVAIIAVAAILLAGPGLYGLDAGRRWARRPFIGSSVALLVGVGAGIGIWVLLNGANPLA